MKSISGKNWEELQTNKRLIEKTKIDENFTDIQAKLVISRNFSVEEIYSIKNHVNFNNPFLKTKDFLLACDLITKHIIKKDNILIIGDYDVDGCLSTSLMVNFLKKNKTNVKYYIPDRLKDGYGANKNLINRLIYLYKPQLIIFLDCGSNSYEALKSIDSKKISSLIIDHHNIQKPYPLTQILINPKKECDYKKYDYLCTVFLTYFFIDLCIKKNNLNIEILQDRIYVILATIADVMPMRDINRLLALNVLENFDIDNNSTFNFLFKILK